MNISIVENETFVHKVGIHYHNANATEVEVRRNVAKVQKRVEYNPEESPNKQLWFVKKLYKCTLRRSPSVVK